MMILGFPPPPAQTLSEWLEIATRELTDDSRDRVRPEIEAHYSQAIETHRGDGLSESEAQVAALAELGDAHAAGKRFRKLNLTANDINRLKRWDRGVRSIWYPLCSYFFFWLYATDLFRFRHYRLEIYRSVPLLFASALVIFVAVPTACFLVARYARARSGGPVLLTLIFLSSLATFAFIYAVVLNPRSPVVNFFIITFYWQIMMRTLLFPLGLWIKLIKTGATAPREVS